MRYHGEDSIVDKIFYIVNNGLSVISVKIYGIETNNTLYGKYNIHCVVEFKDESNNTKYMSWIFNIRDGELIDIMVQDCAINDEIYRSIVIDLIKNVYEKDLLRRGNKNDVLKIKGMLMQGYSSKSFIPEDNLIYKFTGSDLEVIKNSSRGKYRDLENKIKSIIFKAIGEGKYKVSTDMKDKWYVRLILNLYGEKEWKM